MGGVSILTPEDKCIYGIPFAPDPALVLPYRAGDTSRKKGTAVIYVRRGSNRPIRNGRRYRAALQYRPKRPEIILLPPGVGLRARIPQRASVGPRGFRLRPYRDAFPPHVHCGPIAYAARSTRPRYILQRAALPLLSNGQSL